MKTITLTSTITECQMDELSADEQQLVNAAIAATTNSYAPFSWFHVGAAVRLADGTIVSGCNQENVSYPVTICAERSALHAAGALYPNTPVTMLAIAARTVKGEFQKEPISPCGICRQAIIQAETRYGHPIRILLHGKRCIYAINGISTLMPLSFKDF